LFCPFFFVISVFIPIVAAYCNDYKAKDNSPGRETASEILRILKEQPESIEACGIGRVYIRPDRLHITRKGVYLKREHSSVPISRFAFDEKGIFLPCSAQELSHEAKEANEHFDRAVEALIEAVVHSISVGAVVEVPPLAIYEIYQASQNFIEAAKQYNEYCRLNGYDWREGSSNDNNGGSNYADPPAKTRVILHHDRTND